MKDTLKITLLKRKFQSLTYIEAFISNYQKFVQTGLDSFEVYQKYRQQHSEFAPDNTLLMEEDFWEYCVKPNFKGMLQRSKEALKNARMGKKTTVRSLAGSFRGLSRGFDGIEESFMDIATPKAREKYLQLWKLVSKQASNIEKTINNRWKDSSILDEEITGPIDEQELLNYLNPDESID